MSINHRTLGGGPVASNTLPGNAPNPQHVTPIVAVEPHENLIGDIAGRQHHVNMRICELAERAEKLANKLFGAAPKGSNVITDSSADGVMYLIQQIGLQHESLNHLEDALAQLERL